MQEFFTIKEIASSFGLSEDAVRHVMTTRFSPVRPDFYTIPQLADRRSCSRGSVYNVLRSTGVKVVDFAAKGSQGTQASSSRGRRGYRAEETYAAKLTPIKSYERNSES